MAKNQEKHCLGVCAIYASINDAIYGNTGINDAIYDSVYVSTYNNIGINDAIYGDIGINFAI